MSSSTDFLRLPQFWRFYTHLDATLLDGEVLKLFGTTAINGRPYAESTISLACGQDCFLDLTMTPQLGTVNLGLRSIRTNQRSEMGWWDDARWHPFALRWSELERLHQYWLDAPIDGVPPSAAFLLLAVFIGHGVEEAAMMSSRKQVVAEHYRHLDLFSPSEVAELSERTIILPSEDDYKWSHDAKVGWVFGGEYPCYSLRNWEHAGGEEGRFPFAEWSGIVSQLPSTGGAM